ncbi:MAG: D-sedoheptulose 7-phosphate isomerase [Bacteroidales bacterium]|nr:D-sedoheptulose 7-phosphate isomerase [Bacteroidales bacterium]
MDQFISEFAEAQEVLLNFIANNDNFDKLEKAGKIMAGAIKNGRKIISCGNGGSMADAMHFAEELTGRYRDNRPSIAAISISDPTHLTCVANDYGYDFVFSRFLEGVGNEGDVLLAISTSGNSANVIKAAETAKAKGLKVVGLTGKDGGKLATLCDVEIRVAHNSYADRVQEIHIKVIHSLIKYIESNV